MPPENTDVDQPLRDEANVDGKDEAGVSQETEHLAAADPSTATDASKPEGALSVVRDVVDARKQEPAAASSATGEEESGTTPGEKVNKEPDNENFSDVPFHKHPRFQQVVGRLKAAEPDAQRYRNVQNFLDTNGVTADEAAEILTVGALAKTQPAEAFKRLTPWLQKLLVAAGEVLPDDLQQRVQKNELTADAALEISRARSAVNSGQAQRTFEQQRTQRTQQQQAGQARLDAAQSWETDRRLKDPNFEAKFGLIQREVAYLIQTEGQPKDANGVTDQLKRAYDAVNKTFRPPAAPANRGTDGKFQAVRPVTGGQVAAAQPAQAKPMSTLEIVRANRMRKAS